MQDIGLAGPHEVKSYSQLVSHEIGAAVFAKYARRTWLVYFTDHIVEIFMCF
jgi:hypothetical protein